MNDAKTIEESLRIQEKAAQGMFKLGEISKSELAGMRLQLSTAALARLDALAKAQQAFQQLEDAVQSPLTLRADLWERSPRQITGAESKTMIR